VSIAEHPLPVSAAETARLFADLADEPALALAISGGPDSTALLLLVARWRQSLTDGPKLLAVTIDHGLRPESAAEAEAVRRLAETLAVSHRILRWTGPKPAAGLQEAARAARYRLLAAAADEIGAGYGLTAHTLDDQAETVLMRMARGSGLTGLAGMARVTTLPLDGGDAIKLVRPFLDVPKARLIATLEAAGIAFADDPSNRETRFTRVRLRGLMPALAAEGLDAGRLALLARRVARADAALESAVNDAMERLSLECPSDEKIAFDAKGFAALPDEIALRLIGATIASAGDGGPVELGKLEALFAALAEVSHKGERAPRFRRTLAGASITLDGGRLVVECAPARRRRHEAAAISSGGRRRAEGTC
jgi:tRNA(Ile)-lysidine synthase